MIWQTGYSQVSGIILGLYCRKRWTHPLPRTLQEPEEKHRQIGVCLGEGGPSWYARLEERKQRLTLFSSRSPVISPSVTTSQSFKLIVSDYFTQVCEYTHIYIYTSYSTDHDTCQSLKLIVSDYNTQVYEYTHIHIYASYNMDHDTCPTW